ncbi:MAG: hypothetical protein ASARMPREDX12_004603 [Alectoria sarmentosa]|nr:MAG: hypothetical protein ASARMPREDX12_004603 [Alectoria sarmentosa]
MDESITSPLAMKPAISLPQDPSTVDYESEDEKQDSDLQLLWSRVMDEGKYKTSSTYTKVEVLLLCWEHSCNDLTTKDEVDSLKATFENRFNYHVEIRYLDTTIEQRLQVRVNTIVAAFVGEHDGPNTLLIVYYAGHGRPGGQYGDLELFGQTSPNDTTKRLDVLVWNKTEKLLLPAEADVLEVFDCCYAGQLGLRTKGQRSFEYLAATEEMGSTKVPGKDSFTSALIYALETLVEEREDGRFTTVELLNKIKVDAPHFPKDQTPMLINREKKFSAGRIMLHPLQREGSEDELCHKEAASLDPFKGHALTLHFDFSEKPSQIYLEMLGRELNEFFQRNVGVNRVRWGGMRQSMVVIAAKSFQAKLRRNRRANMRLQPADSSAGFSQTRPGENAPDPLTPSSLDQHSPRIMEPAAQGSPVFNPADLGDMSLPRPLDSNDESEGHVQDHRGRHKRRRRSLNSDSPS